MSSALCEGVMNSVDSGSTEIDITITPQTITITDNGQGFKDEHVIDRYFSTLGTEHVDDDATFGRFRMGRAQMFKYGKNIWRSNTFEMTVDTKNRGMVHDVITNLDCLNGCEITIELYDILNKKKIAGLIRQLSENLRFLKVPVTVNNTQISHDPATVKFPIEDAMAYYKPATSSSLSVYNMGVLVSQIPRRRVPCGGVIISKVPLSVNMARNDIDMTTPQWKHISDVLRENAPTIQQETYRRDPNAATDEAINAWIKHEIDTLTFVKMPNPAKSTKTGGTLLSLIKNAARDNTPLTFNKTTTENHKIGSQHFSFIVHQASDSSIALLAKTGQVFVISNTIVLSAWETAHDFIDAIKKRLEEDLKNPEIDKKTRNKADQLKSLLALIRTDNIENFNTDNVKTTTPDDELKAPELHDLDCLRDIGEITAHASGIAPPTIMSGKQSNYGSTPYWFDSIDDRKALVFNSNWATPRSTTTMMATILFAAGLGTLEENMPTPEQADNLDRIISRSTLVEDISEKTLESAISNPATSSSTSIVLQSGLDILKTLC